MWLPITWISIRCPSEAEFFPFFVHFTRNFYIFVKYFSIFCLDFCRKKMYNVESYVKRGAYRSYLYHLEE